MVRQCCGKVMAGLVGSVIFLILSWRFVSSSHFMGASIRFKTDPEKANTVRTCFIYSFFTELTFAFIICVCDVN